MKSRKLLAHQTDLLYTRSQVNYALKKADPHNQTIRRLSVAHTLNDSVFSFVRHRRGNRARELIGLSR